MRRARVSALAEFGVYPVVRVCACRHVGVPKIKMTATDTKRNRSSKVMSIDAALMWPPSIESVVLRFVAHHAKNPYPAKTGKA